MKICSRCKIEKPLSEFYKFKTGRPEYYCKDCKKKSVKKSLSYKNNPERNRYRPERKNWTNQWFRDRYEKNKEFVQAYKLKEGCADCGYNEHHAALEFDHLEKRKRGTVSALIGKSMKVILEEIALCEVVCGCCHNIRTWNRRQAGFPL